MQVGWTLIKLQKHLNREFQAKETLKYNNVEVNDFTVETEAHLLDISNPVGKVKKRKMEIDFDTNSLSPEYVREYTGKVGKTEDINRIIRHLDDGLVKNREDHQNLLLIQKEMVDSLKEVE